MRLLSQFHLVIKYKKGINNKVDDILSRPSLNASIILQNSSLAHENYIEQYARDSDFMDVYDLLTNGAQVEELYYHVHDKLLYHLDKFFIPQDERVHVIREAHSSRIVGHVGVGKTLHS